MSKQWSANAFNESHRDMIGIDNLNDKMDQNKQLMLLQYGGYDLSLFTFRQGLPKII